MSPVSPCGCAHLHIPVSRVSFWAVCMSIWKGVCVPRVYLGISDRRGTGACVWPVASHVGVQVCPRGLAWGCLSGASGSAGLMSVPSSVPALVTQGSCHLTCFIDHT